MNETLRRAILKVDERVVDAAVTWLDADADADPDAGVDQEDVYLVAAMASAALAAAEAGTAFTDGMSLNDRKVAVDGAATVAAEKILRQAPFGIRVAAGEGERDDSPGAYSGQWLGTPDAPHVVDGVFDYVDGTELAATNQPGALTLGGFGGSVRPVPDLQAYAILAPVRLLDDLDLMLRPEDGVAAALDAIARSLGKSPQDLVVSTHSLASRPMHSGLIDLMRARTRAVLVPESVTVEPPYLLSLVGLSEPRIDSMIGAIGLSELAFAAGLVDLLSPGLGFTFRLASISGPRAEPSLTSLDALFKFSEDEQAALRSSGWCKDRSYTSADLVEPGTSRAAALFAVTDNQALAIRGPEAQGEGAVHVEGFLVKPSAKIGKIRLGYRR
ncbi:fructose-bisphosphatase class II [Streptomyces europaeiscabiei]|uniref:fructose-bisphosphatase class II n=1 Tax=Streptomyces TaxID=1883 RepID=UPI000A3BB012|nr:MULTISPECIES: fructose-bisphosphatase class II [Streptomyces]MDX3615129.1 fructose-bisphosphatase class II [Streptomyces europaeiscabiei]MDX3634382.1 fructose-bisphosphatase class II [Streptomyces europaeiscabiei]MDX3653462.1 fructose-bisphosphatase class II [Streptomyces europaeiscabiei]